MSGKEMELNFKDLAISSLYMYLSIGGMIIIISLHLIKGMENIWFKIIQYQTHISNDIDLLLYNVSLSNVRQLHQPSVEIKVNVHGQDIYLLTNYFLSNCNGRRSSNAVSVINCRAQRLPPSIKVDRVFILKCQRPLSTMTLTLKLKPYSTISIVFDSR